MGREIFYFNRYENEQIDFFINKIENCKLFFDVGANIGLFSLIAAKHNSTVVAFEPSERINKLLNENITLNKFDDKIKNLKIAIGNKEGSAEFVVCRENNFGVGKLADIYGEEKKQTVTVAVDTIDNMVRKYGVPDLIKIDIEGAEWLALKGAQKTIVLENAPDIMIEFHVQEIKKLRGSTELMINNLVNSGYVSKELMLKDDPGHRFIFFRKK